jgi:hypothetical protein
LTPVTRHKAIRTRVIQGQNPRGVSRLLNVDSEADLERARLVEALFELDKLLEQYVPSWYTKEHH